MRRTPPDFRKHPVEWYTPRREAPLPPLEGEVPNEREAEGFVRKLSIKPLSFATLSSF